MTDKNAKKFEIEREKGKTRSEMVATLTASSIHRNALPLMGFGTAGFGGAEDLEVKDLMSEMTKSAGDVRKGKMDCLTDMLVSQAMAMDAMFTEYSRRAMINLGHYPEQVERYANLASKAQNQCRMTAETLARIKRGGKQTVKVVHVHEGGQAVVADNFSAGGSAGGKFQNDEQSHEQGTPSAAMLGYDETWNGVPLSCNEGKETVPIARGESDGSAKGE